MSRSWGHAVRHLTEDEIARWAREGWLCSTGKCQKAVTHATEYSYITGRAGRVSWSERRVCVAHAERFAAKHEVEITSAEPKQHALQQILAAGTGGILGTPDHDPEEH